MLTKLANLISQMLLTHNIKTKGFCITEQPQEIIILFAADCNTIRLTHFLNKCQIPFDIDSDDNTQTLCIYF